MRRGGMGMRLGAVLCDAGREGEYDGYDECIDGEEDDESW